MSTERRCPHCRALVAVDAEWCGQCLRSLGPTEPPSAERPSPPVRSREPDAGGRAEPSWACPVCEHENRIALDACEVCGTAFAKLFAEREPATTIPPSSALAWSLLWPGLGHWKAGRRLDGFARMVLFGWTFGTVVALIVAGIGRAGPLLGLYAAAAAAVYGLSAVDARRAAAGEDPVVASRSLLWASVALVVLSVALATLLILPAARGG